jgi:shikimate kinase
MAHEVFTSDYYYGYRPLLRLERPVALFGLPGARVGRTARAMNLLSGVPFVWLDRRVEHHFGRSVQRVDMEDGSDARLGVERAVLERALKERTHALWALSNVSWTDPTLLDWIDEKAEMIRLDVTPVQACERIRRDVAEDARRHWTLRSACGLSEERMLEELTRQQDALPAGDRVVSVLGRTPMEIAQDLLESMGFATR